MSQLSVLNIYFFIMSELIKFPIIKVIIYYSFILDFYSIFYFKLPLLCDT